MFKTKILIHRLSAGLIEDNGMLYASLSYLDDNNRSTVEDDRIDLGLAMAKIPVVTDNNNELAKRMSTIAFPCELELHLKQSVTGGKMSLICAGFTPPQPVK